MAIAAIKRPAIDLSEWTEVLHGKLARQGEAFITIPAGKSSPFISSSAVKTCGIEPGGRIRVRAHGLGIAIAPSDDASAFPTRVLKRGYGLAFGSPQRLRRFLPAGRYSLEGQVGEFYVFRRRDESASVS